MDFSRFSKEAAEAAATELNAKKNITARVVAPTAADDYYSVSATITVGGKSASGGWAWSNMFSVETAVAYLHELLAAGLASARVNRKFLRTERNNK